MKIETLGTEYLQNLKSASEQLRDGLEKILATAPVLKDALSHNYLSDYEALQAAYWMKETLSDADQMNLIKLTLALMGKGVSLHVNSLSSIDPFLQMLNIYDESLPTITVSYVNRSANLDDIIYAISMFNEEVGIGENYLIVAPKKGKLLKLVIEDNKEIADSLLQIDNTDTGILIEYIMDPKLFISRRIKPELLQYDLARIARDDELSEADKERLTANVKKQIVEVQKTALAPAKYPFGLGSKITLYRYVEDCSP